MKQIKKQFHILSLIIAVLFNIACEEAATNRRTINSENQVSGSTEFGGGNGQGAGQTDGSIVGDAEIVEATVEIIHLIEPKIDDSSSGGTYLKKLTIPKNYNGLLYLAGINISTLTSSNVKVRFSFGVDSTPIDIDATVSTGAGLTPQTGVQVLIMDMKQKPFEDIQLIYDLFDYNSYDYTGTDPDLLSEPTQENRNSKLFCRGLALKDDPTFAGNLSDGCVNGNDVCKYAYAKVIDQGLVYKNTVLNLDQPITPTEAQVQSGAVGLLEDLDAVKLDRCLPDRDVTALNYDFSTTLSFNTCNSTATTIGVNDYYYRGPFRTSNFSQWEIKSSALTNAFGVLGTYSPTIPNAIPSLVVPEYGFASKLFPLSTKFDLPKDAEYLGAATPDGNRTLQSMASNGESLWMDGCNARATSVDTNTGEHVGSCSVTATIAIVVTDDDGGETIRDITDEVKLQLVKPADINLDGINVLLSSFQSCSSSGQCGSDECCISKRCWSKSIVSQCVEDLPSFGNLLPGASCGSDHECASLCCNQSTGKCAVHDTLQEEPVLCSKASGQQCIASEWCMKHPVTQCFIVKTGIDVLGTDTCALRCYTFEKFGDCQNGICKPPPQPDMPVFNPDDPNKCATAIDPPNFDNN